MDKQDAKQSLIMLLEGAERLLVRFKPPTDEELRDLLVKTFAQTVEYGAMCSECCSSQGRGDKVLCEMSGKPLKPDDYCPQQIEVIENVLPKINALFQQVIERDYVQLSDIMPVLCRYAAYIPEPEHTQFDNWMDTIGQTKLKEIGNATD